MLRLVNAHAHQLHGKGSLNGSRVHVRISDGTRSKSFDFSPSPQVC